MKPKRKDKDEELLCILALCFLKPLFLMWCWKYFQEDFGLPVFGYWKCFWFLFAASLFRPPWYKTRTEWMENA